MSPPERAHRNRRPRRDKHKPAGGGTETIYGRNAVLELVRAGRRQVHRLRVAEGAKERGALQEVLAAGRDGEIPIERVPRAELDLLCDGHQGVVAETTPYPYVSLDPILERAKNSNQAPLILLLDVLQDPQNVGTLMRTALAVGVHGVILPPRRSVGVTPGVVAASAGTCEHLLVSTGNLVQVMDRLKAEDLWILGLEPGTGAQSLDELDLTVGIGLVVGGESGGMRRLVRESCDVWVSLPMREGINSLNAAVAGAIMLYTIWRERGYVGARA
ncbi:MAG TPA: 23S rRNA (guanosine(2251)-2'-O)-methyltransferase RlmB [Anaerolineae bacterium]|nr:23S rRNA (guanosine(2251)-2'-O)-methyltransferase RlmB [Anaerolineae bacterium]